MIEDIKKNEIELQELDEDLDEISGGFYISENEGYYMSKRMYRCKKCKSLLSLGELDDGKCKSCGSTFRPMRRRTRTRNRR